ncbi:sec7 domain-containing protein [Ditylenchus destructor]|uniref:Sec7 domain-containing protein n=1 Tax=Ditylenchus destructor TaxID=166010 RepID=A0AAD4R6A0_9BILA|nr:sec7 domain-containing protein [Ditylenchus destructor]
MACFTVADLTKEEQQQLSDIRLRKTHLLEQIQQIQDELEQVNSRLEGLDVGGDGSDSQAKMLTMAKKRFNTNPEKGLRYMFDNGLLRETPESVASFLYECDGLRKSAIGDYLGEKEPFNLDVLTCFVRNHDFRNLSLVQALRTFLWNFRLPGEAQKIDRIMEHFAKHFCEQHPDIFDHPDTCYTLCYATIMLNTSLYNPNVKDRMTLDGFQNLTNSMNVSKEMISNIYNSIRSEAFKFPDEAEVDVAMFFQSEKQGFLSKQGAKYKAWNRRWFVLSNKCLYYFELPTDKEPRGIIPLENVRVRSVDDKTKPYTFEIYSKTANVIKACKADSEGKLTEGCHTAYRMAASSHDDMLSWISAIQRSINKDQFLDLLQSRRRPQSSAMHNGMISAKSDPTLNKSH